MQRKSSAPISAILRSTALTASLLFLSACGVTNSTTTGSHGFGMKASSQSENAVETASFTPATVTLNPTPYANAASAADRKPNTSEIDEEEINPVSNPNATFKGCWYKTGKNRYQAVDTSVGIAGTYPFNAVLYNGTTCNPADKADQFGFGDPLTLGKANYTFWFSDFKNRSNMSAIWYLGSENSKCVSYATAPTC
jgi:hypothetical protein